MDKVCWIPRISLAMGWLRSWRSPRGLRILLYHSVIGHISSEPYDLSVEPQLFLDQMRWLKQKSAHDVVSLQEGVRRLHDGINKPSIAVTFDDGYRDNLSVAAPILTALKIPFTVFVTTSYIESNGQRTDPYLTPDELRRLSRMPGASIGAHGRSHRPLTHLSESDLYDELVEAKRYIEKIIDQPVIVLSYPHGAVNVHVREAAQAVGYTFAGTSLIGINRPKTSLLMLRRTEVTGNDRLDRFIRKVRGDYDWYSLKQHLYWPLPRK